MDRKETRREGNEIGWAVVGKHGAIEFWMFSDDHLKGLGLSTRSLGGVETHQRTPFEYSQSQGTPDHEECPVLDGPCWHDGTSLWASEHWIPKYRILGEEWVWAELERTYRKTWGDE